MIWKNLDMPGPIAQLYSKPSSQNFELQNYRQFGGSWGNLKERHSLNIFKKHKIQVPTTTSAAPAAFTSTPIEVPPQKHLKDDFKEEITKAVAKATKPPIKQKGGHKRSRIDKLLGEDNYW